jgi:hypothetical protein
MTPKFLNNLPSIIKFQKNPNIPKTITKKSFALFDGDFTHCVCGPKRSFLG